METNATFSKSTFLDLRALCNAIDYIVLVDLFHQLGRLQKPPNTQIILIRVIYILGLIIRAGSRWLGSCLVAFSQWAKTVQNCGTNLNYKPIQNNPPKISRTRFEKIRFSSFCFYVHYFEFLSPIVDYLGVVVTSKVLDICGSYMMRWKST